MPKKITKTVNKHDKINGSGKKRCTRATHPFVNERNKIDQPPYVYLSRYLRVVRLPLQNSDGAKKLGGSRAARKRPIGEG
ncbi:hypothetical protein [Bacillus cereus]|uniref:hypothetical protein n=1 Tax=Bacillus cereus TaxID=1396 RepID=UPI003D65B3C8